MAAENHNTVSDLIALAKLLLSKKSDTDYAMHKLEQYVSEFQAWWEGYNQGLAEVPSSLLEQLSDQHELVLEFARELQSLTGQVLQDTRRKSKGMIAYVDSLPKRISSGRVKKG